MKKFNKILVGLFLIIVCIFAVQVPVNADSGWDSDYDSGSSWDSSDWGSSDWGSNDDYGWSSRDHDYGSSSGSSDGSYNYDGAFDAFFVMFGFYIVGFIVIGFLYLCFHNPHPKKKINRSAFVVSTVPTRYVVNNTKDWTDEEISEFIPGYSKEMLLKELYDNFVNVQNAWMEFDYDGLKSLCTDELFESYKSDLEILKAQNGKNIMSDFNLIRSGIINIKKEGNRVVVLIFIEVTFHDYVINVLNNNVTRGNKITIMHNLYNLEYVMDMDNVGSYCPNCGAKVDQRDCPYCGSHIDAYEKKFVLSKKTRI